MEQRTKHIVIYASVAIVCIAVGLVAGKLMWGRTDSSAPAPVLAEENSPTASPGAADSDLPAVQSAPPTDPLAACEASVKSAADKQGTAYEKGDILISFGSGVTYEGAVGILDSYGLKPHNGASQEASFGSNHFLTVDVPANDEFKEICTLREKPDIKYAAVNYTFKLAE